MERSRGVGRGRGGAASARRRQTSSDADAGPVSPTSSTHSQPLSQRGRSRSFNVSVLRTSSGSELSPSRASKGEKPAKPSALSQTFTMHPPSPTLPPKALGARKRARTFEDEATSPAEEDGSVSKGGHSLRKRARVDYTALENDEDPSSPPADAKVPVLTAPRPRKRKAVAADIHDEDADEPGGLSAKKQRLSRVADPMSSTTSRRKQPVRKPTEAKSQADQSDNDVKDTIEVGGAFEDSEYSEDESSFDQSEVSSSDSVDSSADKFQLEPTSTQETSETQIAADEAIEPSGDVAGAYPLKTSVPPEGATTGTEDPAVQVADPPESVKASDEVETSTLTQVHPGTQTDTPLLASGPTTVGEDIPSANDTLPDDAPPSVNKLDIGPENVKEETKDQQIAETDVEAIAAPSSEHLVVEEVQESESLPPIQDTHVEAAHDESAQFVLPQPAENGPDHEILREAEHEIPREADHEVPREADHEIPREADHEIPRQADHEDTAPEQDTTTIIPAAEPEQADIPAVPLLPDSLERLRRGTRRGRGASRGRGAATSRARSSSRHAFHADEPGQASTLNEANSSQHSPAADYHQEVESPQPLKPHSRWAGLTPYVDGCVFYPEAAEMAVPTPSAEANHAAIEQPEDINGEDIEDAQDNGDEADGLLLAEGEYGLDGSPTATPAAFDTPFASPFPEETGTSTPGPEAPPVVEEIPRSTPSRNQYPFKKLRDPADLIAALKDHKSMSTEELSEICDIAYNFLVPVQAEYLEQKKITDDEDNAARRRPLDVAYETKVLLALKKNNPAIEVTERDFVVKGIRAREPVSDPSKHYAKGQDKLMSQIYLFEWDNRESMVGKQDPEAQRDGLQNSRLRNRPKQTQKAAEAEAEETLGVGKRVRRKKAADDESQEPSRAGTPSIPPTASRRGRRSTAKIAPEDDDGAGEQGENLPSAVPEATAPPKKTGRRGRGARSQLFETTTPQELQASEDGAPEETLEEKSQPQQTRKRKGRGANNEPPPPVPAFDDERSQSEVVAPVPRRPRINIINNGFNNTRPGEITSTSFYANPSPTDDSRPSTATSEASTATVQSSYGLRTNRKRNYREPADDPAWLETPPKKRRSGTAGTSNTAPSSRGRSQGAVKGQRPGLPVEIAPAPQMTMFGPGQIAIAPATQGSSKQRGFKSMTPVPASGSFSNPGSGGSSRVTTPVPLPSQPAHSGTENGDDDTEKEYRQMTKSEKMSHSMKTRWASGSMAGAVAKRKATLAAKKAAQQQQQQQHAVLAPAPASEQTPTPTGSSAALAPAPNLSRA